MRLVQIYGIHNKVTRKWYIGQSIDAKTRFHQHMYCPCQAISEDLNRYGRDSFEMKVLAEVPIQYGSEAEQAWYDDCSKWCEMYNSFRPNANTKLPHHEKEYEQHLDVAYRFLFPIHP